MAIALVVAGISPWSASLARALLQNTSAISSTSDNAVDGHRPEAPNIAFFDGADPPLDELQAFDAVVLDPAQSFDPASRILKHTTLIARTSAMAGETPDVFMAQQVEPLWRRGYRGVLVDTPSGIAAIGAIHAAHPDAKIMVAGEGALPAAAAFPGAIYAVVGASLIHQRDATGMQAIDVPPAEREARIAAAHAVMRATGVPVVSIEYCAAGDRACAREAAQRVVEAGLLPYATDLARDLVGIGRLEVMPRKILVIQDRDPSQPIDLSAGVRVLATPLNYLGYDVEYADFSGPLPANVTPDRYAGVVAWIQNNGVPNSAAWRRWVDARIADHVPMAFLGQFGFDISGEDRVLDLQGVPNPLSAPLTITIHDPMVGFETMPRPDPRDLTNFHVGASGHTLLRIAAADQAVDEVGIMPWGGFALNQYTIVSLDGIEQERWAIQPIAFLSAALRLPALPSPSVTTENGRRLMMIHVDGDGFASRAEFPGPDYSGEALYEQIFTRYPLPMTLSVIEGEVGPSGLYPAISPRLEQIARKMFALPYVEIGTHTYSHPFTWEQVDSTTGAHTDRGGSDSAFSLNIPNYKFNLDREISGSIDYINSRLAPPGKHTLLLQWSGDCMPPGVVVRKVYAAGVLNMNGGDTVISKSADSWTNIAPIGVDKGPGAYQVYAPNQDENVYTNDWQGPFYGFTRVLETFDMTEHPRRFKPIDIYYHMYSGTKMASLHALQQIFTAVLGQAVLPVHVTDYIRKVLDWRSFAVAKEGDAWVVRGNGEVRELHWAQGAVPQLADATGVSGYADGPDGTYIHFDDGAARFALVAPSAAAALPYIIEANGFVRHFERTPSGLRFEFGGYYQPFVKLGNAGRCRVSIAGVAVAAQREGSSLRFESTGIAGDTVSFRPVEIDCEH